VLHRRLQQEAALLNTQTPVMLNQYVRLDGVSVTPNNIFQYRYTVLNISNPDSLVKSSLHDLKEGARITIATSPEMEFFRQNRVTFEYIFSDETGRIIQTIKIIPEDYN
jgi:hypothetical protein